MRNLTNISAITTSIKKEKEPAGLLDKHAD